MNAPMIKFLSSVSTEMVLDESKPEGHRYVGEVWYDNETAILLRRPCWNINNGSLYLSGFESREAAVAALLEAVQS